MALLGTMLALMLIMAMLLVGVMSRVSSGPQGAGGGALDVANTTVSTAAGRVRYYGALNLAETGVRSTLQWMSERPKEWVWQDTDSFTPYSPAEPDYFTNSSSDGSYLKVPWDNGSGSGSGNSFRVKIYPYASNVTDSRKKFVIESVGEYQGQQVVLRAGVRQESFARYAVFLNNMPDYVFSSGNSVFGGPVHVNAGTAMSSKIRVIWNNVNTVNPATGDSKDQIFKYNQKNAFTTSAAEIDWNKASLKGSSDNPRTSGDNPSDSDMEHIVARGGAVQTGAGAVEMPASKTTQQESAWHGKTAPTTYLSNVTYADGTKVNLNNIGVTVPTDGGIAIRGDVEDMVLRVDPGNPTVQIMDIYQRQDVKVNGPSVSFRLKTTVTIDRMANSGSGSTVVRSAVSVRIPGSENPLWVGPKWTEWSAGSAESAAFATSTNGVIYSTGKINNLRGKVADNVTDPSGNIVQRNALTISTDPEKDLTFGGSLTYNSTDPNPDKPAESGTPNNKTGILGVVSRKIQIQVTARNPEDRTRSNGTKDTSELRDVKIHGTVFAYDTFEAASSDSRSIGRANLLGGYIVNRGGWFGELNKDNSVKKGLRRINNYDQRVKDNPPPGFPSTGSRYTVFSFQRIKQSLDGVYPKSR